MINQDQQYTILGLNNNIDYYQRKLNDDLDRYRNDRTQVTHRESDESYTNKLITINLYDPLFTNNGITPNRKSRLTKMVVSEIIYRRREFWFLDDNGFRNYCKSRILNNYLNWYLYNINRNKVKNIGLYFLKDRTIKLINEKYNIWTYGQITTSRKELIYRLTKLTNKHGIITKECVKIETIRKTYINNRKVKLYKEYNRYFINNGKKEITEEVLNNKKSLIYLQISDYRIRIKIEEYYNYVRLVKLTPYQQIKIRKILEKRIPELDVSIEKYSYLNDVYLDY